MYNVTWHGKLLAIAYNPSTDGPIAWVSGSWRMNPDSNDGVPVLQIKTGKLLVLVEA